MPRAVEIRVDSILKAVVIDSNFPNREVNGATWEPHLLRLGWDNAREIWEAIEDCAPTTIITSISLRDSFQPDAEILLGTSGGIDHLIIQSLREDLKLYYAHLDEMGIGHE